MAIGWSVLNMAIDWSEEKKRISAYEVGGGWGRQDEGVINMLPINEKQHPPSMVSILQFLLINKSYTTRSDHEARRELALESKNEQTV